ncbi:LLM class flavin-dependent oxidoreductase [Conexibacter sp. CPCC 206217]|uniref:LLM class flavin-dependent oxidoreductase n=1 Tax=Conexibacter sp. CPCC 206217 TaxID=3064574 RepID=UPI002719D0DD|nr:LLM class flavin-dependent oxidoreductase [Conexibacter sp. CPCC 206217]MDO8208990.1 LLM class flavin-dependent oxidoreductase [Conexibacter sp. CPCC 206217]
MPSYGRPLSFGANITPTSSTFDRPVRLALLSETLGYELVTFRDQPYNPALLDAWTLVAWVAARTERVHIAANVLALPLRPPAILARAAISLSLLSGGRFALGLGAGGAWDGIESMGGRRLTPGEGVQALEEAVAIIRSVWDAGEPTLVNITGDYYEISGARRGPLPPHPIPIWIGAHKPKMLRLIGRHADGWLPALSRATPEELTAGNALIDDTARAAGREPRAIRRLLNIEGSFDPAADAPLTGTSAQWTRQLAALALGGGFDTFLLTTDDADTIRQFAEEVVPAVRAAVEPQTGEPT